MYMANANYSFIDECENVVLGIGDITAKPNQQSSLSLFVDDGEGRGVIHGVFKSRIGQFTALCSGTIGFVDLGECGCVTGKCHDVAVEAVDELFETTHRVTLGIDRDKQHGHLVLLGTQAVA